MEDLSLEGQWWITAEPNNRVYGVLSYSDSKGCRLDLRGRLANQIPAPPFPIILGESSERRPVTLTDSLEVEYRLGTSSLVPSVAYLGAHFTNKDQIRFDKVEVHYSHLHEWLRISGFEESHDPTHTSYQLTYHTPNEILTTVNDCTLTINFLMKTERSGTLRRTVSERQTVQFESPRERSLDEFLVDLVAPFQAFLSVATDRPNFYVEIFAQSKIRAGTDPTNAEPYVVKVFFDCIPNSATEYGKQFALHDVLFTYEDIKGNCSAVIQRWYDIYQDLFIPVDSYLAVQDGLVGAQGHTRHGLQSIYLLIAQAAESYHRTSPKFKQTVLKEAEHRELIESIKSKVSEEEKRWLTERLQWSNEPKLKQRMRELVDCAEKVITPINTKKKLIDELVATRHYYTHYNRSNRARAAQSFDLLKLTWWLYIIVQMCLLLELRFDESKCVALIQKTAQYETMKTWS